MCMVCQSKTKDMKQTESWYAIHRATTKRRMDASIKKMLENYDPNKPNPNSTEIECYLSQQRKKKRDLIP